VNPTSQRLRDQMHAEFDCVMPSKGSHKRADKKLMRQIEKRQQQCERVIAAYTQAWRTSKPMETREQAVQSVAAILFPLLWGFILPIIMQKMIEWIWSVQQAEDT